MADFKRAYDIVRKHEGGYQNIASDPGNYNSRGEQVGTNFGINAKRYEYWIGRPPSEFDMKNMSLVDVRNIYFLRYWTPIKGNDIRNQNIANILFDGAVNHGVSRGTKLMQEVVKTERDGQIGPITLGAINSGRPNLIYNQYKQVRANFYYDIVRRKPQMKEWLPVWLNRINSFTAYGDKSISQNDGNNSNGELISILLMGSIGLALSRV